VKPRVGYVRKYARDMLQRCGVTEPPVDLRPIVEKVGLEYQEVDYFPEDVDAMIVPMEGRVVAVVNMNQSANRRRFSLAHELCHHLLHQDRTVLNDRVNIDSPPGDTDEFSSKDPYEAEADIFAGELLVPLPMLKRHFKSGMTAADIARIFAVSEHVASIAITTHFNSLFK
jgi:Zn-dependent peptidase ImmA (M78 family)